MSGNRPDKQQRRKKRQASEERSRAKRQQRLALPLEVVGAAERLDRADAYFNRYWEHQNPDGFLEILHIVEDLNLLKLEEYRHTFGAAVASVFRMHPEHQKRWTAKYVGLVNSAQRICPDPEDGVWRIEEAYHADQAMVQFMVTGNRGFLEALWESASTGDENLPATRQSSYLLGFNQARVPEVQELLTEKHPQPPEVLAMQRRQEELGRQIMELEDAHRVTFVAWLEAEKSIIIGTMDEGPLKGAPTEFDSIPVKTRRATPEEWATYRRWRDDFDAPL